MKHDPIYVAPQILNRGLRWIITGFKERILFVHGV
jgi:hypothetical protein